MDPHRDNNPRGTSRGGAPVRTPQPTSRANPIGRPPPQVPRRSSSSERARKARRREAAQYLNLRRQRNDWAAEYRAGRGSTWDAEARRPIWRPAPVPLRQGPWPGLQPGGAAAAARTVHVGPLAVPVPAGGGLGPPRTREEARRAARRVAKRLATVRPGPGGPRFRQILGWGGVGVVCVFDGWVDEQGTPQKVVVKANMRTKSSLPDYEKDLRPEIKMQKVSGSRVPGRSCGGY